MKKILSLILTLCLIFATIGSIAVVNAADEIVVNIAQGAPCTLDDGTVVDTTYPGFQIINGTDGKTYRVNVGTYGVVMYDDMEGHKTTMSDATPGKGTTTTSPVDNATISFANYDITNATAKNRTSQRFENNGENVYAAFGPDYSSWSAKWTLKSGKSVPYRLSFDMKIDSFDLAKADRNPNTEALDIGYIQSVAVQADGANYFSLFPYLNTDKKTVDLHARVYGIKRNSANTAYEGDSNTGGYVEIDTKTSVDENSVFSSEWFNVSMLVK